MPSKNLKFIQIIKVQNNLQPSSLKIEAKEMDVVESLAPSYGPGPGFAVVSIWGVNW